MDTRLLQSHDEPHSDSHLPPEPEHGYFDMTMVSRVSHQVPVGHMDDEVGLCWEAAGVYVPEGDSRLSLGVWFPFSKNVLDLNVRWTSHHCCRNPPCYWVPYRSPISLGCVRYIHHNQPLEIIFWVILLAPVWCLACSNGGYCGRPLGLEQTIAGTRKWRTTPGLKIVICGVGWRGGKGAFKSQNSRNFINLL